MTVLASREWETVLADGSYLRAEGRLELLEGNSRPYFVLQGEHWRSRAHHRRGLEQDLYGAGAMGEKITRAIPETELIERLHLADDDGAPMHAEANGWYAYSGKWHEADSRSSYTPPATDTPHERAARILRVDPAELPAGMDRETFAEFVESLRPRWAEEAKQARALLEQPSELEPAAVDEPLPLEDVKLTVNGGPELCEYNTRTGRPLEWPHYHYRLSLRYQGRTMGLTWRQGLGLEEPPSVADVLENVLGEAAGYENTDGPEDWAHEYGYDEDEGAKLYRKVEAQTARLKTLLGDEYEKAVFPDG